MMTALRSGWPALTEDSDDRMLKDMGLTALMRKVLLEIYRSDDPYYFFPKDSGQGRTCGALHRKMLLLPTHSVYPVRSCYHLSPRGLQIARALAKREKHDRGERI